MFVLRLPMQDASGMRRKDMFILWRLVLKLYMVVIRCWKLLSVFPHNHEDVSKLHIYADFSVGKHAECQVFV